MNDTAATTPAKVLNSIIFHGKVRDPHTEQQDPPTGAVLNYFATKENNGCVVWGQYWHPSLHFPLKVEAHYFDRNEAIEDAVHRTNKARALL